MPFLDLATSISRKYLKVLNPISQTLLRNDALASPFLQHHHQL